MADDVKPALDSTDFGAFKAAVAAAAKEPEEKNTVVVDDKVVDNTDVIDKPADDKKEVVTETAEEKAAREAAETPEAKATREAAEKKARDDKKSKKSVSERIAEFRRLTSDAQEQAAIEAAEGERLRLRAEKAEKDLADLRAGKKPDGTKKDYVPDEGEPKAEEYEFGVIDPAYVRDLTEFKVSKRMEAVQKSTAATVEQREAMTKFEGVLTKGLDKHDDYLQVVVEGADQGKWRLTPVSAQALLDSEFGHEIAYHLASNPAEAAAIAEMTPSRQLLALGRLDARFATEAAAGGSSDEDDEQADDTGAQTQQTSKKVSAAPPPPKKATVGNQGQFTASPDTKDFAAYRRLVQKAQAARN